MGKHRMLDTCSQSPFHLEGRFLGFAAEEGYKLKLIRLATPSGEYSIKVPKELRSLLYRTLVPGEWVQVTGLEKRDLAKGKVKLKAEQVIPIAANRQPISSFTAVEERPKKPASSKQETILVCQKSDCCKRGAGALMQMLQQELGERGLTNQVNIRGTGCMKQCKAGPNLVMPDKSRHSRIRPHQVPALLDQHFPNVEELADRQEKTRRECRETNCLGISDDLKHSG